MRHTRNQQEYDRQHNGEYNATTGATVNSALVLGLYHPNYLALSGGNLFVTNTFGNTISEHNATTGATVTVPSFRA